MVTGSRPDGSSFVAHDDELPDLSTIAEGLHVDGEATDGMHRTDSVDVELVLSGEVDLQLDDGTVTLRPGDWVVQNGTRAIHSATFPVLSDACNDEETHDMKHTDRHRESTWRTSVGRIAAVALSIGGLSALAFAPSTAAAATSPTTTSDISTKSGKLGTILVAGNTVYTLKPTKTACDAACLKIWMPVVLSEGVTTATAGTGVDESKLGTVPTDAGALQVTYSGKPLYWFSKDKAGQVKGNVSDKWGKWSMVVTKKPSPGSGKSNAGSGGTSF